jgi:hypothetical protein
VLPPHLAILAAAGDPAGEFATTLAPILDLGLSSVLVGLVVWLIRKREALVASGEWVPRRELDYTREDRDARLADKDRQIDAWKAAHETSEHTRELINAQNRDLVDALRAQERFFDAFREIIERAESRGGGDLDGA